jgi:hypothetical protein
VKESNELKVFGVSLAQVVTRLDAWRRQREEIAAEVRAVLSRSREMLEELGKRAPEAPGGEEVRRRGRGGRPKGYKASEATRAKLRAAWKRRKAMTAGTPKER